MTASLPSRTIRYHQTGGPEVLTLETIDIPPPGDHDVRIRIDAIGINRVEALQRAGRSGGGARQLPAFIGMEAAGTVDSVGAGVTAFREGQAVDLLPAIAALPFGCYGELALVPEQALVSRPAGLSAVQAAALWTAHLTAYAPLAEIAQAGPGDTVLVTAASSGVGLAAIGIARLLGAQPVAITRTAAKRDALLAAGAHAVIASDEEDVVARVQALTGGRGARVAFDAVAGPFFATLADAMAMAGVIVHYGNLSGAATPLPFTVLARNLTVTGYALDIGRNLARRARAVAFITQHAEAGRLVPVISATYPLQAAAAAHAALEANAHVGKIVLTTG